MGHFGPEIIITSKHWIHSKNFFQFSMIKGAKKYMKHISKKTPSWGKWANFDLKMQCDLKAHDPL